MKTILLEQNFYLSQKNIYPNIYLVNDVIYKRCRLYNFKENEMKIKAFINLMNYLNTYKGFNELNKPINIIQEACEMRNATHAYGYTMDYFNPDDYYLFDDIVNRFNLGSTISYLNAIKKVLKTNLKDNLVYYNVNGNNIMLNKEDLSLRFLSPDDVSILGVNTISIDNDITIMFKNYMELVLKHIYPEVSEFELVDIFKKININKELIEYIECLNNNINPGMFITDIKGEFTESKINVNKTKIKRLQ